MLVEITVEFVGFFTRVSRQWMHDNGIRLAVARIDGLIQSEATAIDICL